MDATLKTHRWLVLLNTVQPVQSFTFRRRDPTSGRPTQEKKKNKTSRDIKQKQMAPSSTECLSPRLPHLHKDVFTLGFL